MFDEFTEMFTVWSSYIVLSGHYVIFSEVYKAYMTFLKHVALSNYKSLFLLDHRLIHVASVF